MTSCPLKRNCSLRGSKIKAQNDSGLLALHSSRSLGTTKFSNEGEIVKVFYPFFLPDKNAQDVIEWLEVIKLN